MEIDDFLKGMLEDNMQKMKKANEEYELFFDLMTNKELSDKAGTLIEASANLEKAEKARREALKDFKGTRNKLRHGIKSAEKKSMSTKVSKPDLSLLEDDEEDLLLPPRKNEPVYPPIPEGVTKKKRLKLKNEVTFGGKKYTVDVEGIMHKLYDKVQAADWPAEPKEQKRWWRLVYAYLKDRKIIEVFVKEKYAPFVNFVVAYCQPDINCKTLADNFGRNVKLPMKNKLDVKTGDYIDVPDTSSVEKLLDGCLKEAS
ncbi:MAG: hypothetical protein K6B45_06030 [Bacteroidaceae bacterium]|nr:hypothetical protein [Bacteroidaceae bacterium]